MCATTKDFSRSYYTGLKGVYFRRILRTIIRLGRLEERNCRVLDFGCGVGELGRMLPGKVDGYDISPELTQVADWRQARYDVIVANEVFYLLSADNLRRLLAEMRRLNPQAELIVGVSRQSRLNRLLSRLGGEPDAHAGTRIGPAEELALLTEQAEIVEHRRVFGLCDVYRFVFKPVR